MPDPVPDDARLPDPAFDAARAGDSSRFSELTEPYRRELQVHCYRILGSLQDAEDLVQETLLRAWRRFDTYQGRAPLRAWLYKIATNACLDVLDRRPKRLLPSTAVPVSDPHAPPVSGSTEPRYTYTWLEPLPDELLAEAGDNPEARFTLRESVTLAFLAALQALPPRQRVVLILCDVLDWHAQEVAELLETSVPSVNSALHRARTTLSKHYHQADIRDRLRATPADHSLRALLDRYVLAWESADIGQLTALLKEDATLSMPPSPSWYRGREAIAAFVRAYLFDVAAPDRWRLRPTRANGQPAFVLYQRDESSDVYRAVGVHVITFDGDRIAEMTSFLDATFVPRFNLPLELPH